MQTSRRRAVVYRLMIQTAKRDMVFEASPFESYKQAVAHVADAVQRHAADDAVLGIVLERGRRLDAVASEYETAARAIRPIPCATGWTALETWGPDVIRRIASQVGVATGDAALSPDDALGLDLEFEPSRPPVQTDALASHPQSPRRDIARPQGADGAATPHVPRFKTRSPDCASDELPADPGPLAAAPAVMRRPAQTPAPPPAAAHTRPPTSRRARGRLWHLVLTTAVVIAAWIILTMLVTGGHPGRLFDSDSHADDNVATELPFEVQKSQPATSPASKSTSPRSSAGQQAAGAAILSQLWQSTD